jgi:hypothetical protein
MTWIDPSLTRNAPASEEAVAAFTREVPFPLPPDYLDFMRETNGAVGVFGLRRRYIDLWPIDRIHEYNAGYGVPEFAPHLLLFGSSGGGEAYAFDSRTSPAQIVAVPFIGLDDEIVYGPSAV